MKVKCINNNRATDLLTINKIYDVDWWGRDQHIIRTDDLGKKAIFSNIRFEVVKECTGMDFHSKFSIGDKVFPVMASFKEIKIPCDLCEGKGKLILKEKEYFCPKCYGKKYTLQSVGCYKIDYTVPFIKDIFLGLYGNGSSFINYNVTGKNGEAHYKEEDLFPSIESAQSECDKRNVKK